MHGADTKNAVPSDTRPLPITSNGLTNRLQYAFNVSDIY